jgi:glutathione S-transferase
MSFIAATIHPARTAGADRVRDVLRQAEHRLGTRDWAVGTHMTIADIHLFRLFWRLRNAFGLSAEEFPALVAHHDRMMARPAVVRTCEAEAALGYELPGWKPAA